MKNKVIRLTESDLIRLVKKVIKEQVGPNSGDGITYPTKIGDTYDAIWNGAQGATPFKIIVTRESPNALIGSINTGELEWQGTVNGKGLFSHPNYKYDMKIVKKTK